MHALSARPSGGKASVHRQQQYSSLFLLAVMSREDRLARALNSRRCECLDMMGGADGAALEELLSEFMAAPGSEAHTPDCKLMNNASGINHATLSQMMKKTLIVTTTQRKTVS